MHSGSWALSCFSFFGGGDAFKGNPVWRVPLNNSHQHCEHFTDVLALLNVFMPAPTAGCAGSPLRAMVNLLGRWKQSCLPGDAVTEVRVQPMIVCMHPPLADLALLIALVRYFFQQPNHHFNFPASCFFCGSPFRTALKLQPKPCAHGTKSHSHCSACRGRFFVPRMRQTRRAYRCVSHCVTSGLVPLAMNQKAMPEFSMG